MGSKMIKGIYRIHCDSCKIRITTQKHPAIMLSGMYTNLKIKNKSKLVRYCILKNGEYGISYTVLKEFCSKECETKWLKINGYD